MSSSKEIEQILLKFADQIVIASKTAMQETMNKIGNDSTRGMVKYSKTKNTKTNKFDRVKNSFGITRLNNTNKLRIQSGNLIRSLVNPNDTNAIRSVKITGTTIIGTIGTSVKSEDGFYYPAFHEFGSGRNGPRYAYFLRNAIRDNENFLADRLIANINKIRLV